MRFGKKLALQVTDDQSGAPYLSHKPMKEAINKTVRELRLYQSKLTSSTLGEGFASANEQLEMESRISTLDRELFDLVDEDLDRILGHVRASEAYVLQCIALLQSQALNIGMLMEESQVEALEKVLPIKAESREVLCGQVFDLRMCSAPMEVKAQLEALTVQYNAAVDAANRHTQYLEINVAGFRKLLKRHEKQIPQNLRARPMPFFGFHQLVTRKTAQRLEVVKQLGSMLVDAWERLANIVRIQGQMQGSQSSQSSSPGLAAIEQPEIRELKNLGAECDMVLQIQKQLKDARHNPLGLVAAAPGMPYPKPGAEMPVSQPPPGEFSPPTLTLSMLARAEAQQSGWPMTA